MAALNGALALKKRSHVAVFVGQNLELDVARVLDELLHVQLAVAEGVGRLAEGRVEEIGQILRGAHDSHSAPAAAGLGLENDRVAHLLGPLQRLFRSSDNAVGAGQDGHIGLFHGLARLFLFAHQAGDLRRRANELDI